MQGTATPLSAEEVGRFLSSAEPCSEWLHCLDERGWLQGPDLYLNHAAALERLNAPETLRLLAGWL